MVPRRRTESPSCLWRNRGNASHPDNLHGEAVPDHAAFWSCHVFVRIVFDDSKRVAYRPLLQRGGRFGERHERNRCRDRDHHRVQAFPMRVRRGPLILSIRL